jgi:hypothetical protein
MRTIQNLIPTKQYDGQTRDKEINIDRIRMSHLPNLILRCPWKQRVEVDLLIDFGLFGLDYPKKKTDIHLLLSRRNQLENGKCM